MYGIHGSGEQTCQGLDSRSVSANLRSGSGFSFTISVVRNGVRARRVTHFNTYFVDGTKPLEHHTTQTPSEISFNKHRFGSKDDDSKKPAAQYLLNGSVVRLNFVEVCHHHPALVLKTATVPHWSGADLVTHTKDIPEKFSKKCVRSD